MVLSRNFIVLQKRVKKSGIRQADPGKSPLFIGLKLPKFDHKKAKKLRKFLRYDLYILPSFFVGYSKVGGFNAHVLACICFLFLCFSRFLIQNTK